MQALWFGYSKQSREDNYKRVNSPYRPNEAIFRSVPASEFSGGFHAFSSAAIIATQRAWYIILGRAECQVLKWLRRDYVKNKAYFKDELCYLLSWANQIHHFIVCMRLKSNKKYLLIRLNRHCKYTDKSAAYIMTITCKKCYGLYYKRHSFYVTSFRDFSVVRLFIPVDCE